MIWRCIFERVVKWSEVDDMFFEDVIDAYEGCDVWRDLNDLGCTNPEQAPEGGRKVVQVPASFFGGPNRR